MVRETREERSGGRRERWEGEKEKGVEERTLDPLLCPALGLQSSSRMICHGCLAVLYNSAGGTASKKFQGPELRRVLTRARELKQT